MSNPPPPLPSAPPARHCTRCFYVIDHIAERGDCPECGKAFDLSDSTTFTLKPPFLWWTFWLPAFITAFLTGAILYLTLIPIFGYGWATVVATPIVTGVVLGYRSRLAGPVIYILLALWLVGCVILSLISVSLIGIYCGLVLGAIALLPTIVGALVGIALRRKLRRTNFSQRWYLPMLLALPLLLSLIEGRHLNLAPVSVRTSLSIPAPPERVWKSIQFYEEVKHRPPLLLRLTACLRPMFTTGSSAKVGDVKTCVYERGRLVKQVTEIIPGKRLAFRVIEQREIETDGVRLIDGSFDLSPSADGNSTTVTLTTRYEPFLSPRFAFKPAEQLCVQTLHGHVLRGMELDAEKTEAKAVVH